MTDRSFELTRRKALIGLGSVGAAGAGAGLGTSALFSDEESFESNDIQAGELKLVVDYYTSQDQGSAGSRSDDGEIDGNPGDYTYSVGDLKPGDSGTLAFCPKVVDNPGYVSASSDGDSDFENGHTEPEQDVDDDSPNQGTLGSPNDGGPSDAGSDLSDGFGELSDAIEVTVSYAGSVDYDSTTDTITCNNTRELNNPQGYTLDDLVTDLEYGVPLDGNEPNDGDDTIDPYPASPNSTTQNGPCLCIEWEVPTDVGNEIQSDALELDVTFSAEQARNNDAPPAVVYNDLYNHFNGASSVDFVQRLPDDNTGGGPTWTWAYTREQWDYELTGWGGVVGLGSDGAAGFELTSGAVIMSNYYGWDVKNKTDPGLGQASPGYSHDFTLELYKVDRSGQYPEPVRDQSDDPDPIAEITEEQDVPGREVPDGSNEDYADIGGTNFLMEWDLGGVTVDSDELLFMVSFDIPSLSGNNEVASNDPSEFEFVSDPNDSDFKPLALDMLNIAMYWSSNPDITAGYSANGDIWWRSDGTLTYFTGDGEIMSRFEGRPL